MSKMREEFEAWATINLMRIERQKTMLGSDMGRYDFGPTQACAEVWEEAWKSSIAAMCVELPCKVHDDNDDRSYGYDSAITDVEIALDKAGVRYK